MDRKSRNVKKDLIRRKFFLKNELKYIILKSIISNKNVKPIVRGFCVFKLNSFKKISRISNQNNPCLLTGRIGGVYKLTQISRHSMVKFSTQGLMTNLRISSW